MLLLGAGFLGSALLAPSVTLLVIGGVLVLAGLAYLAAEARVRSND